MPLPKISELVAKAESIRTWEPQAGFQKALFRCPADMILGGGSAGSGKTDGGLVWTAQDYDKPGYRATIFRRSYPELERHIIPRSHALFKDVGRYNQSSHTWKFKCDGGGESLIEFAFLESEGDVYNHQGVPNARFTFDESTKFSESMIRTLQAWQRTEAQGVKCQTGLFTNPIGPGFAWHFSVFIKNRKPFKLYQDARWPSDGKLMGLTTCFLPGTFRDNKINLERNPDYERNLDSLPDALRNALKFGSWAQNVGIALEFDEIAHTCDPFLIPEYAPRWMAIDWGKDDVACCIWFTYYNGRTYVYRVHKRPGGRIVPYAQECIERSQYRDDKGEWKREAVMFCVLSHECFADKGTEKTQADFFASVFEKYEIPLTKSDKDAEGRTMLIREYFRTVPIPAYELNADRDYSYWVKRFNNEGDSVFREYRETMSRINDATLPKCLIFRDDGSNGTGYLMDTLPHLVTDEKNAKILAEKQEDHGWDALGYGLRVSPTVASSDVNEVYRLLLGERMPDSVGDADRTMALAKQVSGELDEFKPVKWRRY